VFGRNTSVVDPHDHTLQLLSYEDLARHPRGALLVVASGQQHVEFLLRRRGQFVEVRLKIYSARGAGKLLVAESEDVDIRVDRTVSHVHKVIP
jgi:hypothetical protein